MDKITMPDPVAFSIAHKLYPKDGPALHVDASFAVGDDDLHIIPLITTDQAESYADTRVRVALEEAAQICWDMQSNPGAAKDDKDHWLAIAESRILALLSPTE